MFKINTYNDFLEYIEIELGSPVIDQEIHEKHIEHAINKAIEFYVDNTGFNSSNKKLINFTITDPDNIILPENVLHVEKVFYSQNNNRVFDTGILFNEYSMCYMGDFNYDLITYEIYGQYQSLFESRFSQPTKQTYNRYSNELTLNPKPNNGEKIQILANMSFSDDTIFYNTKFVKDYAVAWAKYYWGFILSKYGDRGLSGSITVNASTIMDEAKSEIEKLETDFYEKYTSGLVMMIG